MREGLERDLADLEAGDPAVRQAAERLDDTVSAIVGRARAAESTSAALRRAEQEGDELRRERDRARAERNEIERQRAIVRAELASARQELDAVRTARDNLDRELAEARATIRALTQTQGAGT